MWLWPLALLAFKNGGDGAAGRDALASASASNKHVAAYLIGGKKLPKALPDYYGVGDVNEAVIYATEAATSWRATPGAIDWLMSRQGNAKPASAKRRQAGRDGPKCRTGRVDPPSEPGVDPFRLSGPRPVFDRPAARPTSAPRWRRPEWPGWHR